MRLLPVCIALVLSFATPMFAAEPKPIELKIDARAVETPVLKYKLLPAESELKPGNAVPILLRLPWEQSVWMKDVFPKLREWEERPLDGPEWKSFQNVFPENFFNEMRRAAFRREATWEYPIGETRSPYAILLPDAQGMRGFLGYGLSARIRWQISNGELDKAREGILVGLANGRHLAKTPFYVTQLVAQTIQRTMFDRVDELISQPNSPNLYWALSTLPDSRVDLDRAASLEAAMFEMTLPAINDLDRPRDAKDWRRMAIQLIELLEQTEEIPPQERPKEDSSVIQQFLSRLANGDQNRLIGFVADARAELPQLLKVTPDKVAAMSDEEAGIRWYVRKRLERDQYAAAVLALPPREALPQLKLLRLQTKTLRQKTRAKGIEFIQPTNIYVSIWSLQRKIQLLRVVEAIRDHLATHDGHLPETLNDIQNLPIPLDPLTDQPFQWQVDGRSATLRTPPLPADVVELEVANDRNTTMWYRLRVQ